jgi:hypothetical protein
LVEGEEEMEETGGMFRSSYWLKWFLPGIALIAAAFWAGTMENMILSLAGFLSFFTVGVALIIEGRKKKKE